MAGRIKKKDHEKLDDANVAKVIDLLEQEKPITKKAAYELLNIAANPTRLQKIIDDFKERKEREKRFRAANRGKPATEHEIQECIQGYLEGEPLADIANRLYRSSNFVKAIVERVGVPYRGSNDYFSPALIPEQCVSETFETGQIVWASRHNKLAIVEKEIPSQADYKVYHVYVIERMEEQSPYFHPREYGGRYATQAAFDLGSLEHLKNYGVDVYKPFRGHFQGLKK